eukprot:766438-Hanusia_phi.AAC.1
MAARPPASGSRVGHRNGRSPRPGPGTVQSDSDRTLALGRAPPGVAAAAARPFHDLRPGAGPGSGSSHWHGVDSW